MASRWQGPETVAVVSPEVETQIRLVLVLTSMMRESQREEGVEEGSAEQRETPSAALPSSKPVSVVKMSAARV